MLSHVNKRTRGHDHIKLPLDALLELYLSDTSVPLVKNFAVVYIEMAMERSPPDQQAAAVRFLTATHACTSASLHCIALACNYQHIMLGQVSKLACVLRYASVTWYTVTQTSFCTSARSALSEALCLTESVNKGVHCQPCAQGDFPRLFCITFSDS